MLGTFKTPLFFFLAILATGSLSLSVFSAEPSVPDDWVKTDFGGYFMYLPPEFKDQHVRGIDSDVSRYVGPTMSIQSDYGRYSGGEHAARWEKLPEFRRKTVMIDGKEAEIVSMNETGLNATFALGFPNIMSISFTKPITNKYGASLGLTIMASCRNKEDFAVLERIFSTISFK